MFSEVFRNKYIKDSAYLISYDKSVSKAIYGITHFLLHNFVYKVAVVFWVVLALVCPLDILARQPLASFTIRSDSFGFYMFTYLS